MKQPAYYLWESSYSTHGEYEKAKDKYTKLGYRVVTFQDSQKEHDIYHGLKAIIARHSAEKREE